MRDSHRFNKSLKISCIYDLCCHIVSTSEANKYNQNQNGTAPRIQKRVCMNMEKKTIFPDKYIDTRVESIIYEMKSNETHWE